jgi:hypothetical protein
MVEDGSGTQTPENDGFFRSALGGVAAPPGLRQRILAALDEEDRRRPILRKFGRRTVAFLRHPGVVVALAASLVLTLVLSPLTVQIFGLKRAAIERGAEHVQLQGRVVCYDCALDGISFAGQVACREHGHANGLQLADGVLWRFTLSHPGQEALLSPAIRGQRIAVEGNLFSSIGYIDVVSYASI